jgi:ubiquinone/menaquinone biosynthesis C-methylase UbiE
MKLNLIKLNGEAQLEFNRQDVERAYDRWAPVYDLVFGKVFGKGRKAAILATNRIGGRVLEVGVGTGISLPQYASNVGVFGVDISAEMLRKAQERVDKMHLTNVEGLAVMDAEHLEFPDDSFDVVMAQYVVTAVPNPEACLDEFARVLKPGGVVVLNSCGRHQIEHGFWPYHLIPAAREAVLRRLMPLDALEQALTEVGIAPRGRFVPVDAVLQGPDYFDPRGPLRAAWRAGDSIWSLARPAELAAAEQTLLDQERAGSLERYIAEHDARRREIGQITLLYGTKSASPQDSSG